MRIVGMNCNGSIKPLAVIGGDRGLDVELEAAVSAYHAKIDAGNCALKIRAVDPALERDVDPCAGRRDRSPAGEVFDAVPIVDHLGVLQSRCVEMLPNRNSH
jgi:hypothetical protein